MKTLTITAYHFNDLSDKAKETAREWYREHYSWDNSWSECCIDEAVSVGKLLGITFKERRFKTIGGKQLGEPCIYWSGFWSQGDGACFEGTWSASDVKADEVAKDWGDGDSTKEIKRIASEIGRIAKAWPEATATVTHAGHFHHSRSVDVDITLAEDCDHEVDCQSLREAFRDFMDWIYSQLESEFNYHTSEEVVDESITANEYLFTEEGKRCKVL